MGGRRPHTVGRSSHPSKRAKKIRQILADRDMGHGEEMEERSDKDGRRRSQPLAAFLPPSLYGASFEVGTPLYLMSSLSTEPCPPSRPRMQSIRCDITAGGRELRRGTKCAAKSAGPSPLRANKYRRSPACRGGDGESY